MCRALIDVGYELPGFANLSTGNVDHETSLAARLTQYAWTHWDDPVDVRIKSQLTDHQNCKIEGLEKTGGGNSGFYQHYCSY